MIDDDELREVQRKETAYENVLEARRIEARRNVVHNILSEQVDRPRRQVNKRKRNSVSFSVVRKERTFSKDEPPVDVSVQRESIECGHTVQALLRDECPDWVSVATRFSERAAKRRRLTRLLYKRRRSRLEQGCPPDRATSPPRIGSAFTERDSEFDAMRDDLVESSAPPVISSRPTRRSSAETLEEDEADEVTSHDSSEFATEDEDQVDYDYSSFKEMVERFITEDNTECGHN